MSVFLKKGPGTVWMEQNCWSLTLAERRPGCLELGASGAAWEIMGRPGQLSPSASLNQDWTGWFQRRQAEAKRTCMKSWNRLSLRCLVLISSRATD